MGSTTSCGNSKELLSDTIFTVLRPLRYPAMTKAIILMNALVFLLELMGGEPFVRQWSVIPANIVAGKGWVTIFSAMFIHGGWMHIIGNMVFLHAFGPEVEDAMGRLRFLTFSGLEGYGSGPKVIHYGGEKGTTSPHRWKDLFERKYLSSKH